MDRIQQLSTSSLVVVLCYVLAMIITVFNTPFKDTMYFSNKRVPSYWAFMSINSNFEGQLGMYHTVYYIQF